MRRTIWDREDFFEIGGKRIDMDPEVVALPEKPAPMVYGFNWEQTPLGKVTDIKLEDGVITGEMTIFDKVNEELVEDLIESGEARLGGYYKSVKNNEDGSRVLSADLVGVSVVLISNMPGFPRKRVEMTDGG